MRELKGEWNKRKNDLRELEEQCEKVKEKREEEESLIGNAGLGKKMGCFFNIKTQIVKLN